MERDWRGITLGAPLRWAGSLDRKPATGRGLPERPGLPTSGTTSSHEPVNSPPFLTGAAEPARSAVAPGASLSARTRNERLLWRRCSSIWDRRGCWSPASPERPWRAGLSARSKWTIVPEAVSSIPYVASLCAKVVDTRFAPTRQKNTAIRCVIVRQFATRKTDAIMGFVREKTG